MANELANASNALEAPVLVACEELNPDLQMFQFLRHLQNINQPLFGWLTLTYTMVSVSGKKQETDTLSQTHRDPDNKNTHVDTRKHTHTHAHTHTHTHKALLSVRLSV